jgi:exodeoxyribonuclease VII small subunit
MKKFEERLERLEEIAQLMRAGDTGLDEAMALFEEGVKLSRGLERDLSKAEARVEILLNKPEQEGQSPELGLFDQAGEVD